MTNSVGFKTRSLALIADAVRYSFTAFITAADPCDCRAKFHYFNVGWCILKTTESNFYEFEIIQGCRGIVCSWCQFLRVSCSFPKYSAIAFVAAYVRPCFEFGLMQTPDHRVYEICSFMNADNMWVRAYASGRVQIAWIACYADPISSSFLLPDSWFHLRLSSCRTSRYETLNHTVSVHLLTIFTGAFFNGVFLLALALSIFLQSIERFTNIQPVDSPLLVLIMACIGLGLNILSAFVVHGKFLLLF